MPEPQKVIISCAITGGMTVPGQSASIPITPDQIVESALEAHRAGASILHLHVRDPKDGRPIADPELFLEVTSSIREQCDAIVQPTTGGGVGMSIDERARVLSVCRPEMATFNLGSFNFGIFQVKHREGMADWETAYLESTRDYVFKNTFADMYRMAGYFRESGTKPEFEAYDVGHIYNLLHLLEQGLVETPLHLQFVLGVLGANGTSPEQLVHMWQTARSLLGTNTFTWSVAGIGYPGEFHLGAVALVLGGHFRVGLEDNLRLTLSKRAQSNAQLVEKAAALAKLLDREVATPAQARTALQIIDN
ncbi:MAG TPA: 3-keto-5-aminohexanoate cleavage protein [Candidatus Dormibacteraeota bacterium]|nr:3-keto-5-aminohexanoate cleavage protein [Candidatus Dormibacteraeota bacterium]